MVLADTNILSTFAKINELSLLRRLFVEEGIGVVPAVYEELHNGMVRINIRDNGEGISPEMQSRIFIPNFTTKSSGTGLGLAMCKGIVEQVKGRIWFDTQIGEGTVFHVEIPLVD